MIKKVFLHQQTPFWFITVSVIAGLTLPTLIKDGMFMDAMLYTSVSHNLSQGIGTFWFPQFSEHNLAGLTSFHEQPPLVFGIQAVFYKLFGDSRYVERFYTFLTICISASLIVCIWKDVFKKNETLNKLGWLPLFLWITIPVCFWSYSGNMHENTMAIFILCSALFTIRAILSEEFKLHLLLLSGVFIFFATLSKGIPGFFPITIPFLYWMTQKNTKFSRTFIQSLIITLVPAVIYFVLFLIPESRESLSTYLFKRVLHRISDVPTVDTRFYILWRIFTELIPQLGLLLILFSVAKFKKMQVFSSDLNRKSIFFILIGLAGSAPLMLTLVQKGFYFVPALPFFAIGLSILIAPIISNLIAPINVHSQKYKLFFIFSSSLIVFVAVLTFMQKDKFSRQPELMHDMYLIGERVERRNTVSIPIELWNNFDLQCNLIRYFNISVEAGDKKEYYIMDRTIGIAVPASYVKTDLKTLQYDLYKKESEN